jgi:predicted dehydrogenase
MRTTTPLEVAIVGGGHRGKMLCDVLGGLRHVGKVHLVTRRNARGMQDWIAQQGLGERVALHGKLDPVLLNPGITGVFVANLPAEHFATARWLLENGKNVLVEKPFVATRAEAQALIDLADARGLVLAVGLELFFASYLHYFRSVIHSEGHPHPIERTEVVWHDTMQEEGCTPSRRPDVMAGVIGELLSQVLSLLTVLFGRQAVRTSRISSTDDRLSARLEVAYGPHPVLVSLSRVGPDARRSIEIATREGRRFMLDFTREPGTVMQDGHALPADLLWDALPKPLPAELAYFLDEIRDRQGTLPLLARETMHIVAGTEEAAARMSEEELSRLRAAEPIRDYLPIPASPALSAGARDGR